jgi:putative intracellular protease/amidase
MSHKKVLIAVTSHDTLGSTGRQTGYYLPEVTHPFAALQQAGLTHRDLTIVSPQGGKAPVDPKSYDLSDRHNREFIENQELKSKLEQTRKPSEVNPADYQAIIFAGGHGTMWDFPTAEELHRLAIAIYEQGGIIAAVCHGPAALVNMKLSNGSYLVEGKRVAAFTDDEERAVQLDKVVPFLLASTLVSRGAIHEPADLWQAKIVTDSRVVTGQNPASAYGLGQAVAQLLAAK